MEPLFKNIFLRIEKPKKEEDDLFSEKKEKPPVSEATLTEFSQDCSDIVHTLRDKKVRWNGKYIDVIEETDEYKIILTFEENLTAIV